MIYLTAQTEIMLATTPQDFRNGIDGFVGLCKSHWLRNPRDGVIYGFINKSRTMVRLLVYEGNGYWLMTKRLSKGRYTYWPKHDEPLCPTAARSLRQLLHNSAKYFESFENKT